MKRAMFLSNTASIEHEQVFKKVKTFDEVAESVYLSFSIPSQPPPPPSTSRPRLPPLEISSDAPPPPVITSSDSLHNLPPISPAHSIFSASGITSAWQISPPSSPVPRDEWAFKGFETLNKNNDRAAGEFVYRQWQSKPAMDITEETQARYIRKVLQTSIEGKYKSDWWTPMLRKVLKNGNEWMESKEFFDTYTSGREKANGGIFYDAQSPEIMASRLQIVDERKYKVNKGTFFEQIKRQLRVNPVHLEIFRELVNKDD